MSIKYNEKGKEIPDQTPAILEKNISVKKPLTIEEQVQKSLLRKEYMANLAKIASNSDPLSIDDEFETDEEAFTAAETEYVKSQETFKINKEKFFKAAKEKQASEMALKQKQYKDRVLAEAKKLQESESKPDPKSTDE